MIQGLNNHSHLIIGWVNGIDKKFYLNGSNNIHELVRMRIDEYNQLCEGKFFLKNKNKEMKMEMTMSLKMRLNF